MTRLSCRASLAFLATLFLGCATAPVFASASENPATTGPTSSEGMDEQLPERWYLSDLLDPRHPAEQRALLLENLVLEAERGHDGAASLLGHLHFLGPQHPSALVEKSLDLAEHYFRLALDEGDSSALTNLAEVALARGNAGEAMVWLQAHLIFEEHRGSPTPERGYAAHLLSRIQRAGSRRAIGQDALVQRVQAIMDSHGARMLAHPDSVWTPATGMHWTPTTGSDACDRTEVAKAPQRPSQSFLSRQSRMGAGLVHYLISIAPAGDIVDVVVLSSMPEATIASQVEPLLREMSFTAVDSQCPPRWVRLPVDSANPTVRLR